MWLPDPCAELGGAAARRGVAQSPWSIKMLVDIDWVIALSLVADVGYGCPACDVASIVVVVEERLPGDAVSMSQAEFTGFASLVDPRPDELRAWAYHPNSVAPATMPHNWDLLIATNDLADTLFALAMDPSCPARRFALHCMYIYAAGGVRTSFRQQPRRKLRRYVDEAGRRGDAPLQLWAHNTRALLERSDLFDYPDWYKGGLVRSPRRIG